MSSACIQIVCSHIPEAPIHGQNTVVKRRQHVGIVGRIYPGADEPKFFTDEG